MATKTEEYLRILAEGGDAPADCCMTNTQKLIVQAIERINNLGGGSVVPLTDYFDLSGAGQITDLDGFIQAINDGKAFYLSAESLQMGGVFPEGIYNASIENGVITLSGAPIMTSLPNDAGGGIVSLSLSFDAETGAPAPNPFGGVTFMLPHSTTAQGQTSLTLGKLTINIGDDTYEYDGSQDVDITILDGESMGF